MTSRFDTCLEFVLNWEGRTLEFDPHDPGGVTYCGIDQRDHPGVDVRHLSMRQIRDIYYELWSKFQCGELGEPWDILVFDSAVNPGPAFPVKAMQDCLAVKVDGLIGPHTLKAAVGNGVVVGSFNAAIKCFIKKRLAYYSGLPWRLRKYFALGWQNRTEALGTQIGLQFQNGRVV